MIKELQIRVSPQVAATECLLKEFISKECAVDLRTICAVRILRKSIDARQRNIFINLKVRVFVNEQPENEEFKKTIYSILKFM